MDTAFPTQFTIFDEIGSMASGMAHIHVAIPLNLSTFAGQALVLEDYLSKLSRAVGEDDEQTKIFMQSIREISKFALTRLQRIKAAITHLDVILPVDGDLTQQRQR
jgi:phage baseplate assembly protein W